jgi:hypothetical protein
VRPVDGQGCVNWNSRLTEAKRGWLAEAETGRGWRRPEQPPKRLYQDHCEVIRDEPIAYVRRACTGIVSRPSKRVAFRRRGVETKLVLPGLAQQKHSSRCDPVLIKAVARGRAWFEELVSGRARSLQELQS